MELSALKKLSGSHSPSIESLRKMMPNLEIKVDACFLSNPYATEHFLRFLNQDLLDSKGLRDVLEYYPPQNNEVADHISKAIGVDKSRIFACNGAIEAITAVLSNFIHESLCVIIPTFSSYYEFARPDCNVFYYRLTKENDFNLDVEDLVRFLCDNDIKNLVLINPNNPNGGYVNSEQVLFLLNSCRSLECVVLDESFIHFAYEHPDLNPVGLEQLSVNFSNLVLIKSMSKDFGVAGIRAGYAVMSAERVQRLLSRSFLWNISGLTNYFFKAYARDDFRREYEVVRKKYIMNTAYFSNELSSIDSIKLYPSKANFFLIEVFGISSYELTVRLLNEHGVYVRDCSDKIGLDGHFIRVASRSFEENLLITQSLKDIL